MRKWTGYWSFTSSTTGRWRKQIKGKEGRKVTRATYHVLQEGGGSRSKVRKEGRLLELHIMYYRKVEEADQR